MSEVYVDWALAKRTARRWVSDGPTTTPTEAAEVVAELRDAAHRALQPVADTARLDATAGAATPVYVVDRAGWIDVNVESMSALLTPVVEVLTARRKAGPRARAIGARITGTETGALLGFVASKVLGQFDLAPEGQPSLLLVAPNIVAAERQLEVDPSDFRLWVCLHEETHRVQFTAVPWLREHLIDRVRTLAVDMVPRPEMLQDRLQEVAKALPGILKEGSGGLTDLIGSPEQRDELANVTAIMSLLEGHADVVMDDVGPQIVPSVAQIRRKFDARRKGTVGPDRIIRRLLGLEAKMRQYRDGAAFCRAVQDKVGVDGFNAVWAGPENLPSADEIYAPAAWVERVHG
ncbi:zinc-dependent metalloprotease [Flexivirga sp. B27]